MSFDISRITFSPLNDYLGPAMQQGRVQLDADWNEWLAEINRRIQAGTLDILGRAVYPATTPYAFQITPISGTPNSLQIGPGRMYVDGILIENHGVADTTSTPVLPAWDPALAEMSDAPQPPLAPPAAGTAPAGSVDYLSQPHPPTAALPTGNPLFVYLEAWIRTVTYLQDSNLIDKAVGVDTTGRLQTVWQVKALPVPAGSTCSTPVTGWPPLPSAGELSNGTIGAAMSGPCCVNTSTGYTGMENQCYRVEIHQPGAVDTTTPPTTGFTYPIADGVATFKFSRDNASVITGVTAVGTGTTLAGVSTTALTVLSLGRDQTLNFAPGDWIEIMDDSAEFGSPASTPGIVLPTGNPGVLCQIDHIETSPPTIVLTQSVTNTFTTNIRIIRWDQKGKIYQTDGTKITNLWIDLGGSGSTGDIPVPPAGTMLVLENGIWVSFSTNLQTNPSGNFYTGDFWIFSARTADGSVDPILNEAPPLGSHHHYTQLSVVDFTAPPTSTDCRTEWPPASTTSECNCCCTYTVGEGAQYATISAAISALTSNGGEICVLPGIYYEYLVLEGVSDVVIRGCGAAQTRIASPSFAPGSSESTGSGSTTTPPFPAIITLSGTQHVTLEGFAVEANQEVGVLLDGTGELGVYAQPPDDPDVIDTTIKDLVITASVMPAILAQEVQLLRIDENRIAMENVSSQWPTVWVAGNEIYIERNWVGIQSDASAQAQLPTSVANDLENEQSATGATGDPSDSPEDLKVGAKARATASKAAPAAQPKTSASTTASKTSPKTAASPKTPAAPASNSPTKQKEKPATGSAPKAGKKIDASKDYDESVFIPATVAMNPGGIQIGAPSCDVFVIENQIAGGGFNGITLGSVISSNTDGTTTNETYGVVTTQPNACSTTVGLTIGSSTTETQTGISYISAGMLQNIQIDRNRICNMGLCGIGPAGFFDLETTEEVMSIENLTIACNTIQNTLLGNLAPVNFSADSYGYGAICLPDVQNLTIRDNAITNFGATPGLVVCGIYILNGQMVDISHNQVLETRDWGAETTSADEPANSVRGGIVALVTPPSFTSPFAPGDNAVGIPIFEPTLPAVRVEHNNVRVPLSETLRLLGFGPFSIVDNQLCCGGTITSTRTSAAQTVLILNLGVALELETLGFADLYNNSKNPTNPQGSYPMSGNVLFANNVCQLERETGGQRALANVVILTLDNLTFTSNQTWLDGVPISAFMDAFLFGLFVQVRGNRFQESADLSVFLISALTFGLVNITDENISTYCILSYASSAAALINPNNVSLLSLLANGSAQGACTAFANALG
jgi:hypothetical protein